MPTPQLHTAIASSVAGVRTFCCAAVYASFMQSRPCRNDKMHGGMLRSADYLQIFWRIIRSIFIDVVGVKAWWRISHNAMFITPFPVCTLDFNVTVISSLLGANWLGARMTTFFHSLRPTFTPILAAVSGDKPRIYCNAPSGWRYVRLDFLSTPARANFDYCSRAAFHFHTS